MNDKIKIVMSNDGSHTLYRTDLDEHYHSTYGAIQESRHIFINAGLNSINKTNKNINLLEVGFGSGLNALLTIIDSQDNKTNINYFGVEPIILGKEFIEKLNFTELIKGHNSASIFMTVHEAEWNKWIRINSSFRIFKSNTKIESTELDDEHYNLIYFDAFAPEIQGELWTDIVFKKLYKSLKTNGFIITYSCKGTVKRALKAAGFNLAKLPGPEGKREILKATKN